MDNQAVAFTLFSYRHAEFISASIQDMIGV